MPHKKRFRILDGERVDDVSASLQRTVKLCVMSQAPTLPPQQLSLWSMDLAPNTLVSAGTDVLDSELLSKLLTSGIRIVIDFRLAPSFIDAGVTTSEFVHNARSRGIRYEHRPDLANRFVGESWNPFVVHECYRKYLEKRQELLVELHELIRLGPTLLLGAGATHTESDREIFVNWVLSESDSVNLVVFDAVDDPSGGTLPRP